MDAQADLFHASLGPNAFDQSSPADELACLLHQDDEEIHGPRAERHDFRVIRQKSVCDRQFEGAEAEDCLLLAVHRIFSSISVLETSSQGIPSSRRQLAGL